MYCQHRRCRLHITTSFNSLQTGRTFRTNTTHVHNGTTFKFQFPSNGKDFPNTGRLGCDGNVWCVSIPFKREGLSEQWMGVYPRWRRIIVSIPFKREGLSELNDLLEGKVNKDMFQFPSNGKDFPNSTPCEASHSVG